MLRWRLLTCSMFVLPLALAWQPRYLAAVHSSSRTPHFAPAIAAIADRNRDELLDSDEPLDSGERAALTREMLLIGAPALVGLAMDPVASLVDTAMIGRFCSAADLAGVGVAISVFNLIARTFNFLNSATTSAVAAASMDAAPGTFTAEMARQAAAALAVAIVIGTVIACALVAAGGHLLRGLGLAASGPSAATLYGTEAALLATMPGAERMLLPGFSEAMVRFAARHELARSVEDVLARRSRWLFLDARRAAEAAEPVAAILREELGERFDAATSACEFTRLAEAYRISPLQ